MSGLYFLDALALMLRGVWRWARSNVPRAILFGIVGFAVALLCNVLMLALVYDGIGSAPRGGPAMGPNNRAGGTLFWLLLPLILSGLVSYRLQVGGARFWNDLRGFPGSLVVLVRRDPGASGERILWGFGGAMLVAAILSPALSGLFAVGALTVSGRVLRPLFGALVSSVYRGVVARVAPARRHPPSEVALQVALLGSAVAMIGSVVITNPIAKVGLAVVAVAAALLMNRRIPVSRQAAVATLLIGGAVMLAIAREATALACDGGLAECGGSVTAWLACGAGPVLSQANLAGLLAAGGSVVGGGLGAFDPNQWGNPRMKAAREWRAGHPNAPWSDFYDTSQGPAALDTLRDMAFGSGGLLTVRNLKDNLNLLPQMGQAGWETVKGLVEVADFWLTPDSMASEATKQLRQDLMMDMFGNTAEGARESMHQMAQVLDALGSAIRHNDADTAQKILANFAGNWTTGVLLGMGQEAAMGRMVEGLRAFQGLDIAGDPIAPPGAPDAAVTPIEPTPHPGPGTGAGEATFTTEQWMNMAADEILRLPSGTQVPLNVQDAVAQKLGFNPDEFAFMQNRTGDTGHVLTMNPSSPEAAAWRALGAISKAGGGKLGIYSKGATPFSHMMGLGAEGDTTLAVFGKPVEPVRPPSMDVAEWAKVQQEYTDRLAWYNKELPKMEALRDHGVSIRVNGQRQIVKMDWQGAGEFNGRTFGDGVVRFKMPDGSTPPAVSDLDAFSLRNPQWDGINPRLLYGDDLARYRIETIGMWADMKDMPNSAWQHPGNTVLWDAPLDKIPIKNKVLWSAAENNPAARNLVQIQGRNMVLTRGPAVPPPPP